MINRMEKRKKKKLPREKLKGVLLRVILRHSASAQLSVILLT